MKIEQLLVQHLYNRKELSLQGIGTFQLSESVILPADNEKDYVVPADGISFTCDMKATEDSGLIDYIVQQTGKMKPLAAADLDSFIILSKQFLNIGKPFRMEGIGTLQKNQSGQYDFTPGQYISPRMEPAVKPLKEKFEEDISFRTPSTKKTGGSNSKKMAALLTGVLALCAAGFGAWWFFIKKDSTGNKQPVANTETVKADTGKMVSTKPVDPVKTDSPNASPVTQPLPAAGNSLFKIVFMVTTDKGKAIAKMQTLTARGHKVIMYTADSVTYKLAEPFTLPLTDTFKIKDSLGRWYYGKNIFVETN
jgi:hypothetical protein